ncbi:MAG: hypothetical protein O2962_00695 [Cyanobacteria bacterium]|nr:hypothetical protein [Cyanobacteriota bacterium]
MSVDNLKQDQAEAMGAIAAAQRNLSSAVAAESNAQPDEKERARSKIDQARDSIQIAVGNHASVSAELRMAEGMERKEELLTLREEEEDEEKKNQEAYNKQIQEKKDDAKTTSKDSSSKAPGLTKFTGDDIVRSDKPMTQVEILAEVAKLQKASVEQAAVPTKEAEAPKAGSEEVASKGLASPTNANSSAITSSTTSSSGASADKGIALKAAAGSSEAST